MPGGTADAFIDFDKISLIKLTSCAIYSTGFFWNDLYCEELMYMDYGRTMDIKLSAYLVRPKIPRNMKF